MEVTVKNFLSVLSNIKDDIREADFISLDLEMTGLHSEPGVQPNILDDVSTRYSKLRDTASKFAILQVGLCPFQYDAEKKSYIARPYNFYVFSRPPRHEIVDKRFLCQSSSIDFLCRNKCDFNKVFYEGISFLTSEQQQLQRDRMKIDSSTLNPVERSDIALNEVNQLFIDGIISEVDPWLLSGEKSISLPPCNGFQRRLIYQEVGKKYGASIHLESHPVKEGSHQKYIQMHRMTDEEKNDYIAQKREESEKELYEAVGMRHVIDSLVESKKPIVGHNVALDICFLMSHFFGPLPEDLSRFKSMVHQSFPAIIDTKYLSVSDQKLQQQITSTVLEDLTRFLQDPRFQKPLIELHEKFSRYVADENSMLFHEAGYDAYHTGVGFLKMMHFIGSDEEATSEVELFPVSRSTLLPLYLNKLYLMRSDVPYLNLTGPEEQPSRPNVFFLHSFPAEWKTNDIVSLFSQFGQIFVKWIDSTTAMVTLKDPTQSENVISSFVLNEDTQPFKVTDYASFKGQWKGGRNLDSFTSPMKREDLDLNDNVTPKKSKVEYDWLHT